MNIKVGRYNKNDGSFGWIEGGKSVWDANLALDRDARAEIGMRDGVVYVGSTKVADIIPHYQGWLEDEERTWIAFIGMDGKPKFFLNRCTCGAVVDNEGDHCGGDFSDGPALGESHPMIPHVRHVAGHDRPGQAESA